VSNLEAESKPHYPEGGMCYGGEKVKRTIVHDVRAVHISLPLKSRITTRILPEREGRLPSAAGLEAH
jgi:hypothetical protein